MSAKTELRAVCEAVAAETLFRPGASALALLDKTLLRRVAGLLAPVEAAALRVGPQLQGGLFVEAESRLAVCKMGPSIAIVDGAIQGSGVLRARLHFFGENRAFALGVFPRDSTDNNYLWQGTQCGFYNRGLGCTLAKTDLNGPLLVELNLDTNTFSVRNLRSGKTMNSAIPHDIVSQGFLTIGVSLFADGRCYLLKDNETEVPEFVKKLCDKVF